MLVLGPACSREQPPGPAEEGPTRWFSLTSLKVVELRDEATPIVMLHQVEELEDGTLLAADSRAGKVRHFSAEGGLLGYLEASEDWQPIIVRADDSRSLVYVNDALSRLWRFKPPFDEVGVLEGRLPRMLGFVLHPAGGLVAMDCFEDGMELRTYRDGELVASFLPSDERNVRLGKPTHAMATVDPEGVIYALQIYQPVVRKFSVEGEELGSWSIRRNEYFRDFPEGGSNPFVTHDWEVHERWRRSFTSFRSICWLPPGLVCVFQMNDPPLRPNVLDVYTTQGGYVGSAPVEGYLVGVHGRRLYFTDFFAFPTGDCKLSVYELPPEMAVGRQTKGKRGGKERRRGEAESSAGRLCFSGMYERVGWFGLSAFRRRP